MVIEDGRLIEMMIKNLETGLLLYQKVFRIPELKDDVEGRRKRGG